MRPRMWYPICGLLAAALLWPVLSPAQQETPNRLLHQSEGVYGTDELDWERADSVVIYAAGTYDPKEIAGPGDREILARRDAEIRAQAKLVEFNYGVLIEAVSNEFTKLDATLVTAGVIRDAQFTSYTPYTFEDGSFLYVVRMTAPVLKVGRLLSSEASWRTMQEAVKAKIAGKAPPAAVASLTPAEKKVVEIAIEQAPATGRPKPRPTRETYSGLIVDVREVPNRVVTLLPRLVDETNRRIYGVEDVLPAVALNGDLVKYTRSMDTAGTLAGGTPLKVKALRADPYHPGNLIVSNADGSRIVGANANNDFLSQAKVIFVF